ncbi:hypothetical protein BB560_004025 [Smittium megazygosporum]|uniref:CRAL-TRIO domain-containing protein n=1 Tax=Smittium megazygosporum TaxID=133381 RepID=A0A2T9ZAF1_9FUNG|nr:hypothetical protein BB560_004025 [Smittium megazygosporum]
MAEVKDSPRKQYADSTIDTKGCFKNLNDFERHKLQELWAKLFDNLTVDIDEVRDSHDHLVSPLVLDLDDKDLEAKAAKSKDPVYQDCFFGETIQDKVDFKIVSAEFKTTRADNTLDSHIWASIREDVPDTLILRFLRARKWNVNDAYDMLLTCIKWRHLERVEEIIFFGEAQNEASLTYKGTSYIHGIDKLGYPIVWAPSAKHFQKDQSFHQIKRYLVHMMETARLMLKPPHEKVCLVMDLKNSTLANFDRSFVKLFLKYLEAYYPECLSVAILYKGPWWFSGAFKLVSPWIDPYVSQKIMFVKGSNELAPIANLDQLPKEYNSKNSYSYKYVLPKPNENDILLDTEGREAALKERNKIIEEFKTLTKQWFEVGKATQEAKKLLKPSDTEHDKHKKRASSAAPPHKGSKSSQQKSSSAPPEHSPASGTADSSHLNGNTVHTESPVQLSERELLYDYQLKLEIELDIHRRRDKCQERLSMAARKLDVYTRAKSFYHRTKVISEDGSIDWSKLE